MSRKLPCLSGQPADDLARVSDALRSRHVVMVGFPGAAATMIARRAHAAMPALAAPERWETALVQYWSDRGHAYHDGRPLRCPHHTVSLAGLTGAIVGRRAHDGRDAPIVRRALPGEVTLAHRGMLSLDHLGEFSRHAIAAVADALDAGHVRHVSARGAFDFPAQFRLLAYMPPCWCGFFGHAARACMCSPQSVGRYWAHVVPITSRDDVEVLRIGSGS